MATILAAVPGPGAASACVIRRVAFHADRRNGFAVEALKLPVLFQLDGCEV